MNIRTSEYTLPRPDYIKIAIFNRHIAYGRRFAITLLLLTLVALLGRFGPGEKNYIAIMIGAWLLVLVAEAFIILAVLRIAFRKDNKPYFQSRFMEIESEFITTNLEDGTQLKHKLDNIVTVHIIANAYVILVSANAFLYLPLEAFKSDEDHRLFENELQQRELLQ